MDAGLFLILVIGIMLLFAYVLIGTLKQAQSTSRKRGRIHYYLGDATKNNLEKKRNINVILGNGK